MSANPIANDLFSVGILNPAMRIFDVVMETEYGTSYNSYIVKGSEKTALIETCHLTFFSQYLDNIRQVCDPAEIDYIILNHCEPDHSGVLGRLSQLCPKAQILVSQAGAMYLKNITNNPDLPITVAKDGGKIDLGGKTLQFISAPFLHWPDSMFTWCPEEKALFSCDVLGAHYCEPYLFDVNMAYPAKYEEAFKGYYDAIFGPFPSYVQSGLAKIRALDVQTVCNSHGPVLTRGCRLEWAIERYDEWSRPQKNDVPLIPLFYCSAYGNTGLVAKALQTGILEAIPNADCQIYDVNSFDMGFLQGLLNRSNAFGVGSPTINADAVAPVWNLLSHVDAINNRKRPVLVFGSYGWSGEAVPNLIARLKGLKSNVFEEGFRTIFVPSDGELQNAREFGKRFAQSLGK
ncbi:MAG: FprA family A-type flavoprotein [Oscillospiraceae bacterium]|nr:FprA family A-type flavoprotein [Oscillospiraceae bacterium]